MTKPAGGGIALGLALSDLANTRRVGAKKADRHALITEELMRRLSANGLTLEQCADRRVMNRSIRTLQMYCRRFKIAFADYVPVSMRKKADSE